MGVDPASLVVQPEFELKSIKNKILYLTYDGLADPLGQSQIVPYLNGLAAKGWKFWVISFEKHEYSGTELDKSISWIALKYHKNPPVLSTLYDVRHLKNQTEQVIKNNEIKIVHCRSNIPSLIGLKLKRKNGIKFIFDMRGFWSDERVEGGLWNLNNPVYKMIYNYFKRKEQHFFNEADSIISLTVSGKQELLRKLKYGVRNSKLDEKIEVIPTCVDTELFDPSKISESRKSDLRKLLKIDPEGYVLMYIGSLGTWYMLDEMIRYFRHFKKIKQKSKFVILTNSQYEIAQEEGIIIAKATREEVPQFLAICDITICFIQPAFSKRASSATKIWESLAMCKPVIVNKGWGDIDTLFRQDNLGFLVKSFEDKHITLDVQKILNMEWQPDALRNYVIGNTSLSWAVDEYSKVYQSVTKGFEYD